MNPPNFMIVGAQKSGTTTLHNYLQQHNDVYFPDKKELHFFNTAEPITTPLFAQYLENFESADGRPLIGESTPAYMYYPGALKNISEHLSGIKLITIIRNPISRMYSGYWHERKLGWENLSFSDAILRKANDYASDVYHQHFSYVERSAYTLQLATAKTLFNQGNIKIVRFEDFLKNELQTVNEVLGFLNADCAKLKQLVQVDKNSAKLPRSQQLLDISAYLKAKNRFPFIAKALTVLNRKQATYPKITIDEYNLAKSELLKVDPDILQLYPDL